MDSQEHAEALYSMHSLVVLEKECPQYQVDGAIEALTKAFSGYPEKGTSLVSNPLQPEKAVGATIFLEQDKKYQPENTQLRYIILKALFAGEISSIIRGGITGIRGKVFGYQSEGLVQASAVVYEEFPKPHQYINTMLEILKGFINGDLRSPYFNSIGRLLEVNEKVMSDTASYMRHFYKIGNDAVYLAEIGVESGSRGKGVGGKFLDSIIEHYNKQGKDIFLNTCSKKNMEFYLEHGFIIFGTDDIIIEETGKVLHFYYMRHQH